MTLEEQLAMATSTTTMTAQPSQTETTVSQGPVGTTTANLQTEAQVVQTTTTTAVPEQAVATPPVQMATVGELQQQAPQIVENVGVQTIELGQQVNTRPINILKKLGVGEKIRVAVLPRSPMHLKYHYSDIIGGKFSCFSTEEKQGKCCQDCGSYKNKFCFAVLVYPTMPNDPTVIIPNAKAELRILTTWDDVTYNAIVSSLIAAQSKPVDFLVTGVDSFGRLDVREDRSSYAEQFASAIQQALHTYDTYKGMVPSLIRKNVTEADYYRLLQNTSANAGYGNANYGGGYRQAPGQYQNNGNYQNYNGIM